MKPSDSFVDDEGDAAIPTTVYRGRLFERSKDRRLLIRGMIALLVILVGICCLVFDSKEESSATTAYVQHETKSKYPKGFCPQLCQARLSQRLKHHGGDLLKKEDLKKQVATSKQALVDDLKVKYGSYYDSIMLKDGKWRQGFKGIDESGVSGKRFRRKLKIKLMEMQLALLKDNAHMEGCDCNKEGSPIGDNSAGRRRLEPQQIVLPELKQTFTDFIWTTGGHSAAAGHGNLYNESYTAFMGRAALPIFESVGIELQAKNYAMGGMISAPEFALCQESIFGVDTDVITWDFGMTDFPRNYKQTLYMSRAGVHPNRPAVIGINIHGFDEEVRVDIMKKLEDSGLTTFHFVGDEIKEMEELLPDMLGMNQEQIDAVPEYVRYFKCKDQLETQEPGCGTNKYNDALCANRQHKAPWHPGWKVNSLYGNLMAFFLIEHLERAIEELQDGGFDPAATFLELKKEEDSDYETFHAQSTMPKDVAIPELLEDQAIDPNLLHFAPVFCHTALTPSEIRYKGILTETTEKLGMIDYEQGSSKVVADKSMSTGPMRIVFDENERDPLCPVLTKVDYKDFLYSNEKDGWTHVIVPNDMEKKEYRNGDSEKPKGLIMICFLLCDFRDLRKHPEGDVREEALKDGTLQMKVNGVRVEEATKAAECAFLKHKFGYYFPPDQNGKFKLEVLVENAKNPDGPKQYTRISSIIIF